MVRGYMYRSRTLQFFDAFWVFRDRMTFGYLGLCSFHRCGNVEGLGQPCSGECRAPDSQKDDDDVAREEKSKVLGSSSSLACLCKQRPSARSKAERVTTRGS